MECSSVFQVRKGRKTLRPSRILGSFINLYAACTALASSSTIGGMQKPSIRVQVNSAECLKKDRDVLPDVRRWACGCRQPSIVSPRVSSDQSRRFGRRFRMLLMLKPATSSDQRTHGVPQASSRAPAGPGGRVIGNGLIPGPHRAARARGSSQPCVHNARALRWRAAISELQLQVGAPSGSCAPA
jgi:hypothetical protein